jgi:hypothetical protein
MLSCSSPPPEADLRRCRHGGHTLTGTDKIKIFIPNGRVAPVNGPGSSLPYITSVPNAGQQMAQLADAAMG